MADQVAQLFPPDQPVVFRVQVAAVEADGVEPIDLRVTIPAGILDPVLQIVQQVAMNGMSAGALIEPWTEGT